MILNEYDERDKEIERLYEDIEGLSELISISERRVSYLEQQLEEANWVIKHYANDENWCDYYDEDDEKMTKAVYIDCNGTLKAGSYLEKWGVK